MVDALLPCLGGSGLSRLAAEVGQVRAAEGAGHHVEVEGQVAGQVGVEGIEQVAAELLPARTGEPATTPDGAEGVQAGVAPVLPRVLQAGTQLRRVAEGLLD